MIYRTLHRTTYDYSIPVCTSHNQLHLRPREYPAQSCREHQLVVEPPFELRHERLDYFGNSVTFFTLNVPHARMEVTASSEVEVRPAPLPEPAATLPWEEARERLRTDRAPEVLDAYQFVFDSPFVHASSDLAEYAGPSFPAGRPLWQAVLDLTARIHAEYTYDPTATQVSTPLYDVLRQRRGVCQDFAHLQIGCLRSLGLAARYVSGYLVTNAAPGQERMIGADASHAWLAVYCPDHGWLDIDPTNDVAPSEGHVTVAWGRDYDDVSPMKGVILGGGSHQVSVAVDVVTAGSQSASAPADTPASQA